MTLAPATRSGSPGIDRFSPAQLLRTARLFASDPNLSSLVEQQAGEPGERGWVELDSSPYLQIWLLSWPVGADTGWHDHGGSAGAFLVVSGILGEQTFHGQINRRSQVAHTLVAGEGRPFGPNHIHNVTNIGLEVALSVHLYTPRLTETTRYAVTPTGLRTTGTQRTGVNW